MYQVSKEQSISVIVPHVFEEKGEGGGKGGEGRGGLRQENGEGGFVLYKKEGRKVSNE